MPHDSATRGPRAAYFEDEYSDEDSATTQANVAVKRSDPHLVKKKASYERRRDGSDSGYSSKTGTNTNDSTKSGTKKAMADLNINTAVGERERQPYSRTQSRPEPSRRSSTSWPQEDSTKSQAKETEVFYIHDKGTCQVCDRYGKHVDPPPESSRSIRDPPPPSPKVRQPTTAKDDVAVPRVLRRDSANRTTRPTSMYGAPPAAYQVPYNITHTPGNILYSAPLSPITPTIPYSPITYTYTPTYTANGSYFATTNTIPESRPVIQERRASMYGPPIVNHNRTVDPTPKPLQRTTSHRESRPTPSTRRSDRSDEYDGMPPPRRPSEKPAEVTLAHRPSVKKSATYNTTLNSSSNRRSQLIEDDIHESTSSYRDRTQRPESSHPPSSYRGPAYETTSESYTRPSTRKSVSYSNTSSTTKVASTTDSAPFPRRGTDPTGSDRRVAAVEAYQAQQANRSSFTSADLTAEALQSFTKRQPSSRSESGSHKSHHTKSSSSAGKVKRGHGGSVSEITMNINGVNLSIPNGRVDEQSINIVSGQDGEVRISLGGKEKDRERDRGRDGDLRSERRSEVGGQRRIEKAPSTTSRGSNRESMYGSGLERERERDRLREIEDYERERTRLREREDVGGKRYSHSRSQSRGSRVARERYDEFREDRNVWDD